MVRMKDDIMMNYKELVYTLILGVLLLIPTITLCSQSAPPLLLSLDVERDSDVQALEKIGLKDSATYFVTGEFATKYPKIINGLSQSGTIGSHSHSHPNLTELTLDEVRKDLQTSSQAIEAATGHAPVWFRAPYLEVNEDVLTVARDLGFRYDSSEPERWVQQQILSEFPISINDTGRVLFSDYDFFSSYGLDDLMTLDMLKENYLIRSKTGRPFVFLLHPSIIAEHTEVLHEFIGFVKEQGGNCLSFDQYLEQIQAESPANSIGVRIDLSLGQLDTQRTIKDIIDFHVTDVFISARDKDGRVYYNNDAAEGSIEAQFSQLVHGLNKADIRVHASIPVLYNRAVAQKNPNQAMVDGLGQASKNWISPSHAQTVKNLQQIVSDLLTLFPFAGIHLDELTYPGLDFDYSVEALKKFAVDTGIEVENKVAASALPSKYYNEWVTWRSTQISELVESVTVEASKVNRKILLSASLNSNALTDFRTMELSGQDYRLLAKDLDMVIAVSPGDSVSASPIALSRLISMSRFKIGNRSLLIGLTAPDDPVASENDVTQLGELLNTVRMGANGFLLSPYRSFFADAPAETDQQGTIHRLINSFREPLATSVNPVAFVTEAQAKPITIEKAPPTGEKKSKVGIQLGTLIGGLFLFAFLGFRFIRSRRFYKKPISVEEKTDILNWQKLDDNIRDNKISGQLVHAVAGHLRAYDPVRTSRYRVALIMALVSKAQEQLSLNDLVTMSVDIPGWQVLAMSHLKEAVTHGYLQIDHDRIKVTEKGTRELETIKKSGFDPDHWIFVEQRLHESLHVSCPHCDEDNLAHWYWRNFTCSRCNKEVSILDCTGISRRNSAIIALDQHYYV